MDQTQDNSSLTQLPDPAEIGGLPAAEAEDRLKTRRDNTNRPRGNRTVGQIVRGNCLTLFNGVNLGLAVLIVIFGDIRHTLFFGVALCSTLIGIVQELRAKRMLDRLSILRETDVEAVRGGETVRIRPAQIVPDDILRLRAGDQITADGVCTHVLGLLVNEALITGEADEVEKRPGDSLWSGSFVTAGAAYIRVTAVGRDSLADQLSMEAKKEKKQKSQLVQTLGLIVKILTIVLIPVGLILFAAETHRGLSLEAAVTGTAAALVGMIPQGLILLTNVAFAVGVVNLGKRKTLVQSLPCIEALARVDVLCLDKTGTITDGSLAVSSVIPLNDHTEAEAAYLLTRLLAALPDDNATAAALREAFPPVLEEITSVIPVKIIPFTSSRKYSGAVFPGETILLGAASHLPLRDDTLCEQAEELARDGGRVLTLVHGGEDGASLSAVALIVLESVVRPEARDTFACFQSQGVTLKVISGDSAAAASGIARQAGIARAEDCCELRVESGELRVEESRSERQISSYTENNTSHFSTLNSLLAERTIFGRVSPWQKRALIRLMRANGHTVAMTGDGVNDVLALKEADCGVAMAGGNEAARAVADLVLLNSDLTAMIPAVNEGRRVINNIEKMASLYLSKTLFSALLALIFIFLGGPYPFTPIQLTLIGALTIGIPSFVLTLEPDYRPIKGNLLRTAATDAAPTALAVVMSVLLARELGVLLQYTHQDVSTVCAFVTGALGLALVGRAAVPFTARRFLMFAGVTTAFLCAFLFFPGVFRFSSLLGAIGLAAMGLSAVGISVALLLRKLVVYLISLTSPK